MSWAAHRAAQRGLIAVHVTPVFTQRLGEVGVWLAAVAEL